MQELVENINKLILLLKVKTSPIKLDISEYLNYYDIYKLEYYNLIMSTSTQYEKNKFNYRDLKIKLDDEQIIELLQKIQKSKFLEELINKLSYERIIYNNTKMYDNHGYSKYNTPILNDVRKFVGIFNKTFDTDIKVELNYEKNSCDRLKMVSFPNPYSIFNYISTYIEINQYLDKTKSWNRNAIVYFIKNLQYIEREQTIYFVTFTENKCYDKSDYDYILNDVLEYRYKLY